jgi:hypothetical protein
MVVTVTGMSFSVVCAIIFMVLLETPIIEAERL